jgi:hypothetical protein
MSDLRSPTPPLDLRKLRYPANTPNGVGCPYCGTGMVDDQEAVALLSDPLQVQIYCPQCGWQWYRYL